MQQFAHALQETWRQDKPLDVLKTQYAGQYNSWQTQQRQGLPIAADTFKTLEAGLAQLQRLFDIEQAQSTATPLQQEKLLAAQQLCQAWETNNEEAMTQYRALASPSTLPAQTVDQPSPELATLKPEEKSAAVNLTQRLESELGEPPCGFTLLTASVIVTADDKQQPHAAYTTATEPQLALLITDASLQDHPYWRAYTQLWQWRQQCQNPAQATTTTVHVWVATPRTLPPHILWATCEGSSQTTAAQTTKLFAEYQQQCDHHLQTTNDGQVPFARNYGYQGLQTLFTRPLPGLPASSRPQAIVDALLNPLQDFLLHVGLYYGVPAAALASSAKVLDALTAQARFSAAFIADLRAALAWAEGQQARITTTAARGGPPLTPAQQRELQQHHQHAVQALWQRCQVTTERVLPWSLTSGPAQYFDPLWEQFEDIRTDFKQGKIILAVVPTNVSEAKSLAPQQGATLTDEADHALDFLVRFIVHRQRYDWADHQQYLFDLPPACRLAYVEKLAQALPPAQQSLVTRLRHAPLPNGRRLTQEIEQRDWEKALQTLWQPAGDSVTAESKSSSGTTPVQITRVCQDQTTLEYQLKAHDLHPTIARQLFKPNGEWQDKGQHQAGNHRVYPISAGGKIQFWVKVYPEQPASEFLVTELDRRLGVEGTPHMELVKFQHGGKTSAAVITSAVNGVNLQTVVDKVPEQLQQLPLATFVSTLLRVLLTNPEDDKGDDYFLVPQADRSHKLVRIDNERAFFQPSSERQKLLFKSEHLLVKSIIYCLEQMQWQWADDAAVATVIEDFLHLQPVALVSDLLQAADQLHDGWNVLFSEGEVTAHFNCKDPWASLPVMCIPNGLARELITRLTTMHTALRMEHNHMTGLQLLKVTQPKLAQYYVASHSSVSSPTQTLFAIPFRAEQKSVSPTAESKHRTSASATTRETAADHTRVSARFERIAGHLYQKKNKKDSQSGQRSLMPNSVAMQSSLRLESPVDLATLQKVRSKQTCSAKQQLAEFEKWQKSQRLRLIDDLFAQKTPAVAEWQSLPLRHQHLIFTQLQTKAKDKQLSVEQKRFILKALAAVVSETAWPQLDFNGFEDTLTDALLEPLLKGASQQLLQLNVNGCTQLTDKSFKALLAYNPHLRRLQAQQARWSTVTLTALPHLEELDLSGSAVQTLVGDAPSLRSLQLKDCQQLHSLGKKGAFQNNPFSAPKLTQFGVSNCRQLTYTWLSQIMSLNKDFIQALEMYTSLASIGIQPEAGQRSVPVFLIDRLPKGISKAGILDNRKLALDQFRKSLYYDLAYDRDTRSADFYGQYLDDADVQALAEALKSNTTLTELNLGENYVGEAGTQALAEALKINSTLAHLNFVYNLPGDAGAQALAETLKTNTTLTTLDLGSCKLGDAGAQALVETLKTNTTLTTLNLSGIELGEAGETAEGEIIGYMARNRFLKDPTLATLSFRDGHLSDAGAQILAGALKTHTALTTLDLRYNRLGDAGAQALAEALKTNTTLTTLNLEGNQLGDASAQVLAETLKIHTALTSLGLSRNRLGDAGAQALAEALKIHTALTVLELGWNQLGDTGAQALAEALKTNTALTTLELWNNRLGNASAQSLAEALKTNAALTTLHLGTNQIGEEGAQALADALKTNAALTTLHLGTNQIGEAGVQALTEALKTNTVLTSLDLSDNRLGDAGVQALTEALKTNTVLTSLDLSDNRLGDAGKRSRGVINAYLVRNRMQKDSTLTYLNLNNQLGAAGVQALAAVLKTNTTLTSLDLDSNQLGDTGAQALTEALKTNTTLTSLDLSGNQLGDVGVQALAEALKTNTTLTRLNLGNNQPGKVGKAAEREIEGYLARNRKLQETAKPASQPKDSKSAPSSVPPQDKKETKGESKTSASSEAKGLPSESLSPVETESPAAELSDVTASSAIVTRRTPPSPRGKPPILPPEHKVEVETVDTLSSSQSFTNLPAPHAQFFSSSVSENEKPSALRIEVQPAEEPPALPRSIPPASPRRNTVGTGAASTLPPSPSSPDLSVPHERSASFSSAPEDKKSSALRIEVQLAGGPPALPSSKPPASPPHRYTAGETVTTPPSPQPSASQSARHGQFFLPPSPRDEKAVILLAEVQQALDQAYPASVSEHSDTRQAYLTQLEEYQSRPGVLSKSERDDLRELLANLQQVVAERTGKPSDSPALS
jgi:Ran GTPase-activating protein (RanGAP) involved in mRNA processing and transport